MRKYDHLLERVDTLQALISLSIHNKAELKVEKMGSKILSADTFWLSGNKNTHLTIFSVDDVNSFWRVIGARDDA